MKKEKLLMQKVNKSSVKKGAALCLAMAMACTAFVGCGKKDDAASASGATSESAVEVLDNSKLTEMPDGVSLSEDQMKTTMNAYAAYMTEALASDGYTVAVRYDEMAAFISTAPRPLRTVLPLRSLTCPSSTI